MKMVCLFKSPERNRLAQRNVLLLTTMTFPVIWFDTSVLSKLANEIFEKMKPDDPF